MNLRAKLPFVRRVTGPAYADRPLPSDIASVGRDPGYDAIFVAPRRLAWLYRLVPSWVSFNPGATDEGDYFTGITWDELSFGWAAPGYAFLSTRWWPTIRIFARRAWKARHAPFARVRIGAREVRMPGARAFRRAAWCFLNDRDSARLYGLIVEGPWTVAREDKDGRLVSEHFRPYPQRTPRQNEGEMCVWYTSLDEALRAHGQII